MDALALGRATVLLGGGRQLPEDKIDPAVGIKILKTKGDQVRQMNMRKKVGIFYNVVANFIQISADNAYVFTTS